MSELKWLYKIIRSILFTAVILTGSIFVLTYLVLAIPPVQNYIREVAERELTQFLGGEVEIESLNIAPFNELTCKNVSLKDLDGIDCLRVVELGAGVNFWKLVLEQKIEITFVDLLDFKINIYQKEKDQPLNIDFIIQALSPKDKNKPPTIFDLKIHNIVLRDGEVSFSKLWEKKKDKNVIDFNYLKFTDINADVTLPRIANDHFEIDLRRLTCHEISGLTLKDMSGFLLIAPNEIDVKGLSIGFPNTTFNIPDFNLHFNDFNQLKAALMKRDYEISFPDLRITPSDFAAFFPELNRFTEPVFISVDAGGNLNNINIRNLTFSSQQLGAALSIDANFANLSSPSNLEIIVNNFEFDLRKNFSALLLSYLELEPNISGIIERAGDVKGKISGAYKASEQLGQILADISTSCGSLNIDARGEYAVNKGNVSGTLMIPSFDVGKLLANNNVHGISNSDITFDIVYGGNLSDSQGSIVANIGQVGFLSREFENVQLQAEKRGQNVELQFDIDDDDLEAYVTGSANLNQQSPHLVLNADVKKFDTYTTFLTSQEKKYEFSGVIDADLYGNSIDNLTGHLTLENFNFVRSGGKPISMDRLSLTSKFEEDGNRLISLNSDLVDVSIEGKFNPAQLPMFALNELRKALPSLIAGHYENVYCGKGNFYIDFTDAHSIIEFFNLPIDPLTEVTFAGSFDSERERLDFSTDIPYIVQNGNKLIRDTYLEIHINGIEGMAEINAGTIYPTKKGDLKLDMTASALRDHYRLLLDFNEGLETSFYGNLSFDGTVRKNYLGNGYDVDFNINPTSLFLNDAEWKVGDAKVMFTDKVLSINNFSVRHDDQFVLIEGVSTKDAEQFVEVQLSDIDLSYIFETLNINYVTFGGRATGDIIATELFSPNPQIYTKFLDIKDMSYNGALLGDGKVWSSFDLPGKKVNIKADIQEKERRVASVDGGIWIGKDSLAFNFDTDKIDIRFLKPFMKAFTSDVRGRATGDVTLYGTFKDINMKGKVFADEISLLVDYTNVRYHGSDSVIIEPGEIHIPDFTLEDKYGNKAILNGVVRHTYFHQPEFDFDVTNIDHMLVYDTNAKINPIWYGKIFGSGNARIEGKPGYVNILADMETNKNTVFTFVLSDEQQAAQSKFLTFSDKRKEAQLLAEEQKDTVPEFLKRFQRVQQEEEQGEPDVFSLDLRASVTPEAELILVMDPAAGDKITAYGDGAMNITYDSKSDEMRMFGKYILDRGTYNFSLQDIILKEFSIKPGSSISFTGNPYAGELDITAAYKVNTSLTELDQSFASDRELNRTNVPVEALLKVRGLMTNPDIGFDIDLPTVTEETARKVKSIISTDDMMSRQVIYLVALNKFYSPEYMGVSSTGGEWASVASSTISSQIQNVIGQITDKFTLAPSLRSDKGDFSDLEFDVALSSSLFNNRLLLNGNLGYRDPSTSNTTFVGDFDIEYLLTRKGNLRLKAYNHFNDQNYYLKSALTTQGIGVVWRMDFDNLGTLFKRRKKETTDSIPSNLEESDK